MPWQQQLDANRAEKGALGEPEVSKDPFAEASTGNGGEESQGENGEGHPSAQPSGEARRARESNPQRLLAGCCCALRLAAVGSCEEQPTVAQSCWFCCRFRCWRCLAAAIEWSHPHLTGAIRGLDCPTGATRGRPSQRDRGGQLLVSAVHKGRPLGGNVAQRGDALWLQRPDRWCAWLDWSCLGLTLAPGTHGTRSLVSVAWLGLAWLGFTLLGLTWRGLALRAFGRRHGRWPEHHGA